MDVNKYESKPERYHKIAVRDIKVYEFGSKEDEKFIVNYHNNKNIIYNPNILNKEIEFAIEEELDCNNIGDKTWKKFVKEGHFSYSEECLMNSNETTVFLFSKLDINKTIGYYREPHIGTFIIPKGIEYYENEDGEIISSNLIWTGEYRCNGELIDRFYKLKELKACVGK